VLQYHNVTPAAFFAPYDPRSSDWRPSRAKSWRLLRATDLGLGDSEYNRRELDELGIFPHGPSCHRGGHRLA
jgi:hypothetical protein